jgi:hypothetical protein
MPTLPSTASRKTPPAKPFAWRDRDGNLHPPAKMATSHLFYVLRMIWNHTMPVPAQLPGGRYNFSSFYTDRYMKQAIAELTPELARRHDLSAELQWQLRHMIDWLATHQIEGLDAPRLR